MLEHLDKWSPQHSHMRANPVDVEIPTELSQLEYLETLVQHVGHNEKIHCKRPSKGSPVEKTDQWREKEANQKQRSLTAR